MAQKDLIPMNERTEEEQKKIASKGGKASGEARRRKRTLQSAAQMILSLKVTDADTIEELKKAMYNGAHYFSYEYTGSGLAKAPRIDRIDVEGNIIKITTEATDVYWISATDINGAPSTRKSTVVAVGKEFDYTGFQGRYVRALIVNEYGETCTQPFGFDSVFGGIDATQVATTQVKLYPNPVTDVAIIETHDAIECVTIFDVVGNCVAQCRGNATKRMTIDVTQYVQGHYIVVVTTPATVHNAKLIVR